MLMSMIFVLSFMFIFMKHPLSFGFILLMQTILISLLSGKLNMNYWFSYILFLILIGGLMILFIYMTSIASNEKFKFSMKLLLIFMCMFLLMLFLNNYSLNISNYHYFNNNLNFNYSLNKYLNTNLMITFNLIIIYLLITLIAVVNLTKSISGPLRQTS